MWDDRRFSRLAFGHILSLSLFISFDYSLPSLVESWVWRTAGYFGVFIYVFKWITVEFGLGYDVDIEQYVYSNFDTNIVSTCKLEFSTQR